MYNCVNINIKEFPTAKGYQHQGPNSQRQPTLSQQATCPSHLSTPAPETSRKVSTVEAACPYPDGPTTTEQNAVRDALKEHVK